MHIFLTLARKYFFLAILLLACLAFFYFQLYRYFTFETLSSYQAHIEDWSTNHYKTAVCLYVLVFTLLIACGIPCATFLSLLGGFLFGTIAVIYAVLSTAGGGMILYLAIRTAFGTRLASSSTLWIRKIESGFQKNAFNYLLTLRLIPILPCWVSNIGAGILNVPMKTFLSATLIGVFPSTLIYVLAGRSLDKILAAHQTPVLNIMLTPSIFLPLLALAILSLLPVIYKSVKKSNKNS